jgi:hypothetical protein
MSPPPELFIFLRPKIALFSLGAAGRSGLNERHWDMPVGFVRVPICRLSLGGA